MTTNLKAYFDATQEQNLDRKNNFILIKLVELQFYTSRRSVDGQVNLATARSFPSYQQILSRGA